MSGVGRVVPNRSAGETSESGHATPPGWRSLLRREWVATLVLLLGGVLLQSMSVLMLTTILPSIAGELGGVALLSWPTTAFLASSIVAASAAAMLTAVFGARLTYGAGVATFGLGAILCSLAPSMAAIVAGRLIQGWGGGLEAAVAYIIVRRTFPEAMWSRVIALLSTSWSLSVLLGPLVGGLFARVGDWRGAFIATAAVAGVLALGAALILPARTEARPALAPRMPLRRVALIAVAIAATAAASVADAPAAIAALLGFAMAALAAMLRLDRAAAAPLLPRDAFSLRTPTGTGLWLALLLSITYSPLQIYVPIVLQRLHGLDPLAAGFAVASASFAWTAASLITAGATAARSDRLLLAGPWVMAAGLLGIALLAPGASTLALLPAIVLLGIGIGQCWPFVAERVMSGARPGDETIAAASIPMVQQLGFALGGALAGLAANLSGLAPGVSDLGLRAAAFWVPASFVAAAAVTGLASFRLRTLRRR